MNETKRRIAEKFANGWRQSHAYLLEYDLFIKEYWADRDRNEAQSDSDEAKTEYLWYKDIETIWDFCLLVDASSSPLQEYRKKYAEKLSKASEIVEMNENLFDLIKSDRLTFVNEIRAVICATTCDVQFSELMRNYRILHRYNVLLFEDIDSLDIDKRVKTEIERGKLQALLRETEDRIVYLEKEIFGQSEGSKKAAVRKGLAKELGQVFFHVPSEKYSKLKPGDRIEFIEEETIKVN